MGLQSFLVVRLILLFKTQIWISYLLSSLIYLFELYLRISFLKNSFAILSTHHSSTHNSLSIRDANSPSLQIRSCIFKTFQALIIRVWCIFLHNFVPSGAFHSQLDQSLPVWRMPSYVKEVHERLTLELYTGYYSNPFSYEIQVML